MAPATTRALPLACLMPLLLRRAPGAGAQAGQGFEVQQPQDKVSVTVGETLNLTCTMSGGGSAGAMRWLKGLGSGNETVYEQKGSFPCVTRAVNESDTDFSIHIRDVRPKDAGTYYCVKFSKSLLGGDEVFRRGNGTEVSVRGPNLLSSPGSWLGILLEKGLLSGLLVFLFKRWRAGGGKRRATASSCSVSAPGSAAPGARPPPAVSCVPGNKGAGMHGLPWAAPRRRSRAPGPALARGADPRCSPRPRGTPGHAPAAPGSTPRTPGLGAAHRTAGPPGAAVAGEGL
ncbi:tyrosine-protein phosphatase non-receptor type substrate 1-like [Aptenodytes patagonicus]|uniref:tyrosine-protein phosphatase non-receptor type substrate 1-like n=1 Tax=Aptenodytes patagonicus TaxID=9234 RepID=UPI003FA00DDF